MNRTKKQEIIPPMKPRQLNVYSPADIKCWGVERFLNEISPKEPIPNPEFTEEENRRMDEILKEERESDSDHV